MKEFCVVSEFVSSIHVISIAGKFQFLVKFKKIKVRKFDVSLDHGFLFIFFLLTFRRHREFIIDKYKQVIQLIHGQCILPWLEDS